MIKKIEGLDEAIGRCSKVRSTIHMSGDDVSILIHAATAYAELQKGG